ncbi:MAG: sigma-54 dependent transcriptional regulator [Acidobacteria bacterium]|nr:sigma-54 dependent transcriptional regulator [Acidobacteriota bacterium]
MGDSAPIRKVRDTIRKLGADRSTVLITGESGCGKELIARAVHDVSALSDQIFLPVDAASVVGSLMESELFGHKKGAFTGATEDKQGLVRAASGGTLFLDEIGELTLDVQAKLLRLLQEREVRPVGATVATKVNVRVIAATNRELGEEVEQGRFRRDLFYRLNVISIRAPTLRDRFADVSVLAAYFLKKYSSSKAKLSSEAMEIFCEYDWPGNVRELDNAVRRSVALRATDLICLDDLPSALRNFASSRGETEHFSEEIAPLAEVERRHILRTIDHTRGDVTAAAMMLGIGRTTLYRKLKSYGSSRLELGEAEPLPDSIKTSRPTVR